MGETSLLERPTDEEVRRLYVVSAQTKRTKHANIRFGNQRWPWLQTASFRADELMRIGLYLATLDETPKAESLVFTEQEREYCLRRRDPNPHLAGRFAAKKAAFRALNLDAHTPLSDIEVTRKRGRAPTFKFHGTAASIAQDTGIQKSHVSISHSGNYAIALVLLE